MRQCLIKDLSDYLAAHLAGPNSDWSHSEGVPRLVIGRKSQSILGRYCEPLYRQSDGNPINRINQDR